MNPRLAIHQRLASTQDLARELALQGEAEGLAVMALEQTGGRGRGGRSWLSPPGKNLALSLILRPSISPGDAGLLGMMASIAAAETVEERGIPRAELKWPNDVLVGGRKIAGILSEARISGNVLDFVILGIGMNVNSDLSDFSTELQPTVTSLFIATGRQWNLEKTAHSFLHRIEDLYQRVNSQGCGFIPEFWTARWAHQGQKLTREGVTGTAERVDANGALLMRTAEGRLMRITSGEVNALFPQS